jgi:hypothetical protein
MREMVMKTMQSFPDKQKFQRKNFVNVAGISPIRVGGIWHFGGRSNLHQHVASPQAADIDGPISIAGASET